MYGYNKPNNTLEYLAIVIIILLQLDEYLLPDLLHESILSANDRTFAIGWLLESS